MLKALPLTLALSFSLLGCVHFKDYVHTTETLTEAGQKVNLASREAVSACKSSTTIIGKAQAHDIQNAVAAAIRNGQNKAGLNPKANTLLYEKTEAQKRWRTHYIAIRFRGYDCPVATMMSNVDQTGTQASASAEAQIQVQKQAEVLAAQAAAHAAAQAASQAAAQAAAQAAIHQMHHMPPPPMF